MSSVSPDLQRSLPVPDLVAPRLSVATVAVVAAAMLVYVSGSFVVVEILGIKRELEVALILPLAVAAAYYWVKCPLRSLSPLFAFVLLKTVVEVALRGEWIWVLDSAATLLALTVIFSAPRASFEVGVRAVVVIACIFASMAIIQWFSLLLFPELGVYGLVLTEEGAVLNTVQHPVAVLGLFSEQIYTLFGNPVARLQSFAKEPSLNLVYFLLPACLASMLRSAGWVLCGLVILLFCLMSLSGSIFLSLGFAGVWWVALRVVSLRTAFLYGLPLFLVMYLYVLRQFGLGPLFDAVGYLARYGDFLNKGQSLQDRGTSAGVNFDTALTLPFGSPIHPDLPGPWLVNASLEAGWLGPLFLTVFLIRLGNELEHLNRASAPASPTRLANLLLLGTLSTVVVFNDYQMCNYAGIVLVGFLYRLILLRNAHDA